MPTRMSHRTAVTPNGKKGPSDELGSGYTQKAEGISRRIRDDGLGAVVNSSRGILFPFKPDDPAWEQRIEEATRTAVAALRGVGL
jgi:hypothetical protein